MKRIQETPGKKLYHDFKLTSGLPCLHCAQADPSRVTICPRCARSIQLNDNNHPSCPREINGMYPLIDFLLSVKKFRLISDAEYLSALKLEAVQASVRVWNGRTDVCEWLVALVHCNHRPGTPHVFVLNFSSSPLLLPDSNMSYSTQASQDLGSQKM